MVATRRWMVTCLIMSALALSIQSPTLADDSLYQALGGKKNIIRFTSEAIDLALQDDRIKAKFVDTSIHRLKRLLAQQICAITGGPFVYHGRSMKASHAKLHLDNADFNALVEDLQTAMDDAHVSFRTQNKLLALLAPMQRDVVTKQ